MTIRRAIGCATLPLLLSCSSPRTEPDAAARESATQSFQGKPYGKTSAGEEVQLYTLTNGKGLEAQITDYGGIVVSLKVPDKDGKPGDVTLGFDGLEGYLKEHPYFGALIGRLGNRIGKGQFTLNGVSYKLARNNGENHLHGGIRGFDKVVWKPDQKDARTLELRYTSKDGEEGYPGTLTATVTYSLTDANELKIDYVAVTDKDTVVNLTNHAYFNLSAGDAADILGHEMMIAATRYTPVDAGLIPTGQLAAVEGTPFDFRKPVMIGARIDAKHEQITRGGGYDHNYVIDRSGAGLELAARVREPGSGRVMEVWTTEPGVQFYTGNFLDGKLTGKGGRVYQRRSGFCLETQHFPDSPNKPQFPSTVLKPGAEYRTTTAYRFLTDAAR